MLVVVEVMVSEEQANAGHGTSLPCAGVTVLDAGCGKTAQVSLQKGTTAPRPRADHLVQVSSCPSLVCLSDSANPAGAGTGERASTTPAPSPDLQLQSYGLAGY